MASKIIAINNQIKTSTSHNTYYLQNKSYINVSFDNLMTCYDSVTNGDNIKTSMEILTSNPT